MEEKIFECFEKKIEELKRCHLYRTINDIESKEGMKITINGEEYINFASNDYLGLSQNSILKKAAKEAIDLYGSGSGASRLLGGGTLLHKKLEELISIFKDTEASLILNSGYTANTSIIPALAQENDIIFSDELNHASIIDGCRLSRAEKIIYRHNDLDNLKELMRKIKRNGRKIIITDTVFSMDGDLAPITELCKICENESAILYLDDAHGTGVLGMGYGALKHFGLKPMDYIVQIGTFSKALGSFGAFVCGKASLIGWFTNSARGFIFSTALPAHIVASSYAAIKLIMDTPVLVNKLWDNTLKIKRIIRDLGLKITNTQTPIIPILFDTIQEAIHASNILKAHHIFAPVIRPPTVKIPRIRLTATAAHTEEEIEILASALEKLKR